MRVLFCGSGPFAVRSLKAIEAGEHELTGVITQPPRPAGRGGNLRPTPLAAAAAELALGVAVWEDINTPEATDGVRRDRADVICVVDYGQFIGRAVREAAGLGAFNLHASLLPELRGAAPVNWAIIRGFTRTGVTTFSLVDRMDAGPVYALEETETRPDETADELRDRLSALGADLVLQTLDMLASGRATTRQQDERDATRAPRLSKADGWIDFRADAVTVRNRIHGTWPWPGGRATFERRDGPPVLVTIARAGAEHTRSAAEPGTINADLLVATGGGSLRIKQIKPAGKRLMEWRDFVNGYRVAEGDRFVQADS